MTNHDSGAGSPNIVARMAWGGFAIIAVVAVASRQWWLLILAVAVLVAHFVIRRVWPL